MSDTVTDRIDLDSLTDDQVNALSPEEIQALMDQESVEEDAQEPTTPDDDDDDDASQDTDPADAGNAAEVKDDPENDPELEAEAETSEGDGEKPAETELEQSAPADEEGSKEAEATSSAEAKPDAVKEEKPAAKAEEKTKKPEAGSEVDLEKAADFYVQITKPFKADGKDFAVKTPQEAIRLMQMGANYSRRMQELKPLKAMDAMLREHGLDDPAKLSELIDISKGNPEAIQKLLKSKGIDPLDIDVSKESGYKAPDYKPNPKDLAFKEAIDNTMAAPGGSELIADMNQIWDEESKNALYEQPTIFENILAQKESGVYSKINAELARQRTLGFLVDVPFLQAYHQVGDAMQKAGVFGAVEAQSEGKDPVVTPPKPAPIDTGVRKPVQKKTVPANPILSSNPPNAGANPGPSENEPDYSTMSDEDFAKLDMPG